MQKMLVTGNLTQPASLAKAANGRQLLSFTVASNDGNDYVTYIPVIVGGKEGFADKILPYLGKGAGVSLHGKLGYNPRETADAVYRNPRVTMRSLRDFTLTGGKPLAGSAAQNEPESREMAEAHLAQQEMVNEASQNGLPTPDNDSFDDDIPF